MAVYGEGTYGQGTYGGLLRRARRVLVLRLRRRRRGRR